LVGFISCGYPDAETSLLLARAMVDAGVDILELGVPFSDPIADGPTIQAASQVALAGGMTLDGVMEMAAEIRRTHPTVPLVLFSYLNVLLCPGLEVTVRRSRDVGLDAWLVVDMPAEESSDVAELLVEHGLDLIPLVAPTTPVERLPKALGHGSGFAYCITVTGVTGARRELPGDLQDMLTKVRAAAPFPVVAGFGIADGQMARACARNADGVVVGSRFIELMREAGTPETAIRAVVDLVRELRQALDEDLDP
jgi:tryptophan synthase alpha chain